MFRTRLLIVALLGAGLTGCHSWQAFRESVHAYEGGNLDVMVQRLGAPDKQAELPGTPPRVAYSWTMRNQGGDRVCTVTATADKASGMIQRVTDNCPNSP